MNQTPPRGKKWLQLLFTVPQRFVQRHVDSLFREEEKKKYFKRALSILLSCVLAFSTISFSAVPVYAEEGGEEAVETVPDEEAVEDPAEAVPEEEPEDPAGAAAIEEGEPEGVSDDAAAQGEEGDYYVIFSCVDGHGVVCPGEEVFLEAKA